MAPETPTAHGDRGAAGLSRRSVVRAGAGALWVAPVVTLVTAAPALAASSTLTVSGLVATYENNPNPATVNPQRLVVNATLGNTGPEATDGCQLTLSIPGGLFDVGPTATTPAGFGAPVVSGSPAGGWSLVFFKAAPQIASGGSVTFVTTLTLGSTTATPYLGYRGSAFTLSGSASAGNATTVGGAAAVAGTPNADLSASMALAARSFNAGFLLLTGSAVRVSEVTTSSRSGIGQLFLTVSIPKGPSGSRLFAQPTQGNLGAAWTPDGAAHTATDWVFKYKSAAAGFAGSLGPSNASRGPGTLLSTLRLSGGSGTPHGTATWTFTAAHLNATTRTSTF